MPVRSSSSLSPTIKRVVLGMALTRFQVLATSFLFFFLADFGLANRASRSLPYFSSSSSRSSPSPALRDSLLELRPVGLLRLAKRSAGIGISPPAINSAGRFPSPAKSNPSRPSPPRRFRRRPAKLLVSSNLDRLRPNHSLVSASSRSSPNDSPIVPVNLSFMSAPPGIPETRCGEAAIGADLLSEPLLLSGAAIGMLPIPIIPPICP